MTDKMVSTTIEILNKIYPVRCPEAELKSLQQAAELVNQKMLEVKESGKAINLESIAIITLLNMTNHFLQQSQQKDHFLGKVNQKISQLQAKLDNAINKTLQTELIYTVE